MQQIKISKGSIGVPVFKASLHGDAGEIESIGVQQVYCGYGVTEKDAIADFIFENSPDILKLAFKEEKVKKVETKKNQLQGKHPKTESLRR